MVPSAGSTPEDGCGTGPFVGRVAGLALALPAARLHPLSIVLFRLLLGLAGILALFTGCGAPAGPVTHSSPTQVQLVSSDLPPDARHWVEQTLASLTLREKVGQLVMPWVSGEYAALDSPEFDELRRWVEEDRVGGVIVSVGMPHSYAAKLNAAQALARVPLLVTSDMENGPGMRMGGIYSFPHLLPQGGGTTFPPLMALGATASDSLASELGRVLGLEARAVGVHLTFGPVLDVNSNPANPIINTRSFGEDPALVARLATAYMRGAHAVGLMTTGKHFPGHGDTEVDSHIDLPFISATRERLDRVELLPFRAAVAAGIDAVMTAHIAMTGIDGPDAPPATLSPTVGTELLREEMGFRGLLFTDALDMGAIEKRYGTTEPLLMALEAGADVLLMPIGVREAIGTVVAAVERGRIAEARLDASVRRLLEAKAGAGLHRQREVDLLALDRRVGTRAHQQVAQTIAERSLTLTHDARGLVPFPMAVQRVLSVTYANPTDPIAGRAFNQQLAGHGLRVDAARVDERTTAPEFDALRARAEAAELVVVSAYVSPREHAGSVDAAGGFSAFVERLTAGGTPVVAVSFGSPYVLTSIPSVPAYLLAWGGAEVSQRAAARALRGAVGITGKLPVSLPPFHGIGAGIERAVKTEPVNRQ
jgi:beta-N-acetylhexosaminidase